MAKRRRLRERAVETLLRAEREGRFVDECLATAQAQTEDRAARAMLTELVHGASRWRGTLDHVIARYRKLEGLRPAMHGILRVAVYQLGFCDQMSERVAVAAAVDHAKAKFGVGGGKLANAILRRVQAEWGVMPAETTEDATRDAVRPDGSFWRGPAGAFEADDAATNLAARLSYPHWLVARWVEAHGVDRTRAIAVAQNRRPRLHCWVHPLETDRAALIERLAHDGVTAESAGGGVRVTSGADRLEASAPFREGRLAVQDETQAEVVPALNVTAGSTVLEIGAAPGTKTVALALAAGPEGRVVAIDRSAARIERVRKNLARCAARDAAAVSLIVADANRDTLAGSRFDRVLIDAPCSNTGVLARRSDARWRLEPTAIDALAAIQRALLERGLEALQSGGILLYSTCSIESEENERLVDEVLARAPAAGRMRRSASVLTLPETTRDGGYRARITSSDDL